MFDHEPTEPRLTPELEAIERRLARLTAAAPRVDRDRLMYAAGIAAAAQPRGLGDIAEPSGLGVRRWLWPAATALMTAASLLLATMLVWQRQSYELALRSPGAAEQLAAADSSEAAEVTNVATATRLTDAGPLTSATRAALLQPKPGYLGIRYIALTQGVNALEQPDRTADARGHGTDKTEPTQRELLRELLPSDRAGGARS